MKTLNHMMSNHTPWNKDKLTGQKPALKLKEIWSIRTRLQISHNIPELALFNMALIHFVESMCMCWLSTYSNTSTPIRYPVPKIF